MFKITFICVFVFCYFDASAAGGNLDSGGYALWSAMAKETEALKRQLAELSGDPRYKVLEMYLAFTDLQKITSLIACFLLSIICVFSKLHITSQPDPVLLIF